MSKLVEITGISSTLDESHLRELFECCGTIKSLTMSLSPEMTRVCHIDFLNRQEAEAAAMLTGTPLGDKNLRVIMKTEEEAATIQGEGKADPPAKPLTNSSQVEEAFNKLQEWSKPPSNPVFLEKSKVREEELARTIYVGNLAPLVTGTHLRSIFQNCGQVLYLKLSADQRDMMGSINLSESKYAFIEFASREAAKRAFHLHGTPLGDRPMKIGKATSPIFKTHSVIGTDNKLIQNFREMSKVSSILTNPARLNNAMTHVKSALGKITERLQKKKERKKRRYRTKSRSRSRSRSRKHRRSRHKSRSHSKSSSKAKKIQKPKREAQPMVWDGFQWHPRESKEGQLTAKSLQKRVAGTSQLDASTAVNSVVASKGGGQTALELAQEAIANLTKKRQVSS